MWHREKTTSALLATILLSTLFVASAITVKSEPQTLPALNLIAVKAPHSLLMDIKKIDQGRLVVVGERGHILISDNNAKSWRQIQIPSNTLLTKLFFIDDKTGWAVGHQQIILKTVDAGESWRIQNLSDSLDQPAIFDIWFSDSQNGIAVGAYGLYLTTDDAGTNWREVLQPSLEDYDIGYPHFYSLAYEAKSKKLFMAAELGLLAVSDDLGKTWVKLTSPYKGSFFHISALPNGYLVAMGLRGHLFRSIDLGVSWQVIETGTLSGLQNLLVANNKIIIVGSNGTQLVSEDNLKSVKLIQRSDRVHLAAAVETLENKLILVGMKGIIQTELK